MKDKRPARLEWFPFYSDKFWSAPAVRRMSMEQVGTYLALLCDQWDKGYVADCDEYLEDLTGLPPEAVRIVLKKCFDLDGEGWVNRTLQRVRLEQIEKHNVRVANGKLGGRPRVNVEEKKPPLGGTKATPKHKEENRVEEKKKKKQHRVDVSGFETLWNAHRRGPKKDALEAYRLALVKGVTHDTILRAVQQYVKEEVEPRDDFRGAALFRFIKKERWDEFNSGEHNGVTHVDDRELGADDLRALEEMQRANA